MDLADMVADAAIKDFRDLDVSTLPQLRAIRRDGPARARRGALLALLHLGGEKALDPADTAALRRLIAIKLPHDRPQQFDDYYCVWLAVRGGDQQGIMRVLGLDRSEPATYALGLTLAGHLGHLGPERHVFITPRLNGWTLVTGPSCNLYRRQPQIEAWVEELSSRYGDAQSYFFDSQSATDAWLVGSRGRIVRQFKSEEPEAATGQPLPIEQRALDRLGLTGLPEQFDDDTDDLQDFIGECGGAPGIAAALSIDPVWTGWPADLDVAGHPLIAWPASDDDVSILRGCHSAEI